MYVPSSKGPAPVVGDGTVLPPAHTHEQGACVSCDRPAVIDGFCLPCAATIELQLAEDERKRCRDLLAELFPDEDGLPQYDAADHVWMSLYRAGFEIMRRNVAPSSGEDET